jgi:phage tail sheath protein FI
MERLHPGVYIEEIPSGVRPIEGISTSNAAFIGKAEMGPVGSAQLITSAAEFETRYGGFLNDSYLAHAVFQFFNNGGKKTYVVRVTGSGAAAAAISIKDRKAGNPAQTLTIRAANEGAWGNKLDVVITDSLIDPDNEFTLQVLRDRSDLTPPLPPLLLETHENLSMNPEAGNFVERVVAANSRYIVAEATKANQSSAEAGTSRSGRLPVGDGAVELKLGVPNGGTEAAGAAGPPATGGTSRSGDAPSINPDADKRKFMINLDGDGAREITIPPAVATGADIAFAIRTAVRALRANTASHQAAYDNFACVFDTTGPTAYVLTSGTTGTTSSVVVTNSTATGISLPAGTHRFVILINGDGPHEVALTGPLADGDAVAGAIKAAVQAITPKRAVNLDACTPNFICTYEKKGGVAANPSLLLTSGKASTSSSVHVSNATNENVATLLKLGLTNSGREVNGSAVLRPANSAIPATEYHLGDALVSGNVFSVVLGDDGSVPGDAEHKKGLNALDAIRDVNIVAIPGIGSLDVVATGANYCGLRGDCFFVGDTNSTDDTVEEAQAFMNGLTVKNSYAALYYPWLRMADPTVVSPTPIAVPPSGFVAGIYARIDSTRGIWKAPAGTEANVGGAVGLLSDTTDAQQDFLNPQGINVIRQFPASGIVIWGARTLATLSNPEYRYIPVRRTTIFLEQSIYNGIQYAVFEPNDAGLWSSLRLNISAFMLLQFRAGAFQGRTPAEAFFVKVDETTTTQQDIDAGVVNILVGFAPLKPAEFVVLKLTQKTGQPAA